MLFDTTKDIELDIKNKLSQYIKTNGENFDFKMLKSAVWVYLRELKIIHELESFFVSDIIDNTFYIEYKKDNEDYTFVVSSVVELRNVKIEKIKSNKIIKTYIIL